MSEFDNLLITVRGITKTRLQWYDILNKKVDRLSSSKGCWLWLGRKHSKGYGELLLGGRKNPTTIKVNRLALILYTDRDSKNLLACHTCDNPSCIYPLHLYWGSTSDNINDAVRRNRMNNSIGDPNLKGDDRYQSVLFGYQVQDIKILLQESLSHKEIAESYGVSQSCIRSIANGKNWKHIKV